MRGILIRIKAIALRPYAFLRYLDQGSINLFCKEPDNKYLQALLAKRQDQGYHVRTYVRRDNKFLQIFLLMKF